LYSPSTSGERKVLLVLLIISGVTLIALVAFYALNPRTIVGDSLVNNSNGTPAEFPPPGLSPFYTKPVTIMYAASIVFAFCFFGLIGPKVSRLSRSARAFLLMLSVLGLAISAYETLFNFALWGSLLVTHPDPDTIVNSYPVSSLRVNLVFATKSFVALLFVTSLGCLTFKKSLENH
jgi:hypothetical protein